LVTTFGEALRAFRQASNDSQRFNRRLSQERLGELIGDEMGDLGFSGAAISYWELGESKISAEDRNVLLALITVLHKCGGLRTLDDANQLLEAGNYRALNPDETRILFPEKILDTASRAQVPPPEIIESKQRIGVRGNFFLGLLQEFHDIVAKEKEGPSPYWPRVIVAVFQRFSDRLSAPSVWSFILWVWVWLLAWLLIVPSLRWPFSSPDEALLAVVAYVSGAIIIPALIGVLTDTKNNEFWQKKESVSELNLRLYTHQGASIGFHVGYFFIFMVGLLSYNLGLQSVIWMELIALVFPIILGYASAQLIPYNLLLAFKQLDLKDGAIFFVFFLFGPAWGYFLLKSYDILLTKAVGVLTVLLAITGVLAMMVLRYRQSGTTVIPIFWWVIFFGSIVLCQFLTLLIK